VSVSADDVTAAVAAAVDALKASVGADWSVRAGDLEWDCWETAEHVADDLFYYAAQLGAPGYADYLPLRAEPNRPGGEPNTIRVVAESGPPGLLTALSAMGALLASMVRTADQGTRGHHSFGAADASASAAMGVLEVVVHTHDLAAGLGLAWEPDRALCARVLARLTNWQDPIDSAAGQAHLWRTAQVLVLAKGARNHNAALMDLGAMICLPRQPRCGECPVRKLCRAERPELLPRKRKPAAICLIAAGSFESLCFRFRSSAHRFPTSPSALLNKEVAVRKSEVEKLASANHDQGRL